jgi:hypothetical protein
LLLSDTVDEVCDAAAREDFSSSRGGGTGGRRAGKESVAVVTAEEATEMLLQITAFNPHERIHLRGFL